MIDFLIKNDKIDNDRRVVVTGLGVVSSIGIGWPEFWKNLIAGKSGISDIEYIDTSEYDCHKGGEIKNFNPEEFIGSHRKSKLGTSSKFAISAIKMALKDARINIHELSLLQPNLSMGTTMGESQLIEQIVEDEFRNQRKSPEEILALNYPANSIIANISKEFKFIKKNILFANACAAGNYAIGYAYDLINSGKSKIVIAGGVDSLSRIAFTGFGRLFAMSPDICQPFDKNRKGMMLGEGCGIIILESFKNAMNRNANIYAEITGYGMSCDAKHMTNPSILGVLKAMDKALKNSNLKPEDIDYICAHGTGTHENDAAESKAINYLTKSINKRIPVSSIKSMLGHTMGAAAAIETISCVLSLKFGELPPTINFNEIDEDCDIDCIPNISRKGEVRSLMNNSQAFGGNNSVVILKRFENK